MKMNTSRPIRWMWWSALTAAWMMGLAARPAAAAAPSIPPDAVAFYRFDPSRFDTTTAAFLPMALNIAEKAGLVNADFHPLFDGILAASIAGAVPHTVCVLDLDGEYDEQAKNGFRVTALQAVLVLESTRDHRGFISRLGTILSHYQGDAGGDAESDAGPTQELFDLPNGSRAARFRATTWAPWQTVEWASLPDSFVVGLGPGSIERWVKAQAAAEDHPVLTLHRATARGRGDEGEASFVEIWMNFDRLHETMPDILAQGRPRRMLTTWQLDNARNWMFHGRWADEFLVADLTWQRRSDSPDTVQKRSLTLDHWPRDLTLPKPDGKYCVVIPIDLAASFDRVMSAYRDTLREDKLPDFDGRMLDYRRREKQTYASMWSAFKPYVVLSNDPPPAVPVPGATTVYFELKDARQAVATQRRLEALLAQFMTSKDPQHLGESAVRHETKGNYYWLQLEASGTIRVPSWGWAGRYLIGGWGPSVVEFNRKKIQRK